MNSDISLINRAVKEMHYAIYKFDYIPYTDIIYVHIWTFHILIICKYEEKTSYSHKPHLKIIL